MNLPRKVTLRPLADCSYQGHLLAYIPSFSVENRLFMVENRLFMVENRLFMVENRTFGRSSTCAGVWRAMNS